MDLSIVIPAYNEHDKVTLDIEVASKFISTTIGTGEVILVDDGSTDGTGEVARSAAATASVPTRVISIEHGGKGAAVRAGIQGPAAGRMPAPGY